MPGTSPVSVTLKHRSTVIPIQDEEYDVVESLPNALVQSVLVGYRSIGIGAFGAIMRCVGMPLEKIALFMNSTQVSGKGPFRQAVRLTFQDGFMTPYRVVGPASLTAWFLQYSVMGIAFQFFDQTLSELFGVHRMYYGHELMQPHFPLEGHGADYHLRSGVKTVLSPVLAACLESLVSNRAEVQRYFGPTRFATMQQQVKGLAEAGALRRMAGPAFLPNVTRNIVMCQTSFLLTPLTYRIYFPLEHKNKSTLFWYGLGINMFVGNVVAITQQSLWGRSLDYLATHGRIEYQQVIRQGYQSDGMAAFFTGPKWFSRVLMNAPAQGTLPWFYNEILPIGEPFVLSAVKRWCFDPFVSGNGKSPDSDITSASSTTSSGSPAPVSAPPSSVSRVATLTS